MTISIVSSDKGRQYCTVLTSARISLSSASRHASSTAVNTNGLQPAKPFIACREPKRREAASQQRNNFSAVRFETRHCKRTLSFNARTDCTLFAAIHDCTKQCCLDGPQTAATLPSSESPPPRVSISVLGHACGADGELQHPENTNSLT